MKTVLCYGDSNTFGYMPGSGKRYPRNVRWPGVMQEILGDEYYVIEEGCSGRTTVWEDPVEENRNGMAYIMQCLESHRPIDLVIIMLGSNDCKNRFGLPAFDIAKGVETLVKRVKNVDFGPEDPASCPKVLIMAPVPFKDTAFCKMYMGERGIQVSKELAKEMKKVARANECYFLDAGALIEPSTKDGLHYTPEGHKTLAKAVAKKVKQILK